MAALGKKYTKNPAKNPNPTAGYMVPKQQQPAGPTPQQQPLPPQRKGTGQLTKKYASKPRVVSAKSTGISASEQSTWGKVKTGARKAHGAYMKGAKSFWGGVGELSQGMSDISATLPGSDFSDVLQPIRSNGDWGLGDWGFGFGGSGPSDNVPDNRQYRTMPRKQRRVPKPKKQKLPDFGFKTRW